MNEDSIIRELDAFSEFLKERKIDSPRGLLSSIESIRQNMVIYEICQETLIRVHEAIMKSRSLLTEGKEAPKIKQVENTFKEIMRTFWD